MAWTSFVLDTVSQSRLSLTCPRCWFFCHCMWCLAYFVPSWFVVRPHAAESLVCPRFESAHVAASLCHSRQHT